MKTLSQLLSLTILMISFTGCLNENTVIKEDLSTLEGEAKGGIPNSDTGKGKKPTDPIICQEGDVQSISCTLENATEAKQSQICQNNTWVDSGSCLAISCASGYELQNNLCVVVKATDPVVCQEGDVQSISCTLENATEAKQSQICQNNTWVDSGSCLAISCASGYELQNNICVAVVVEPVTPVVSILPPVDIPSAAFTFEGDTDSTAWNVMGGTVNSGTINQSYGHLRLDGAIGQVIAFKDFNVESGAEYMLAATGVTSLAAGDFMFVEIYDGSNFDASNSLIKSNTIESTGSLVNFDNLNFTPQTKVIRVALVVDGNINPKYAFFDDIKIEKVIQQQDPIADSTNNSTTDNAYLENIVLPQCDANNPEVQFIKTTADWSRINDSAKRIFCVSPGNYTSLGAITLTADGTADNRRYIVLNNGNDVHPGKMAESQQANVQFVLSGANYWVIDRMSNLHNRSLHAIEIKGQSKYNILNRLNIDDFYKYAITLYHLSHNNTLQNSRIANQSLAGRKADGVGIFFQNDVNWKNATYIYNTKIINNEFKDNSDAIQLIRRWSDYANNIPVVTGYDGTIMDSNKIYVSPATYTNCSGTITPTGSCSYSENAIDMKAGSDNANNPIVITNNIMWGYRKADSTSSSLSSWGDPVIAHYGVNNVIIEDNIIFDNDRGIGVGDPKGFSFALGNSSVKRNIVASGIYGILLWDAYNVDARNNFTKDFTTKWATLQSYNGVFTDNVAVNGNYATGIPSGSTNYVYSNTSGLGLVDYTFSYDVYTASPKQKTFPSIKATVVSPAEVQNAMPGWL